MKYANFKKMIAVMTAAAMVYTPVVAMADEVTDPTRANGNATAEGELEDYVKKDVFSVVLPTSGSTVSFTLDPQGLLNKADPSTYGTATGAVYFANVTDSGTTYSDTSDAFQIINKSSYDVDVEFSVNVTLPEGVSLVATEAELADATAPSVYLAMFEGSDAEDALVSGTNTYATKQLAGVPEVSDSVDKGYEIKTDGDADTGYTFSYGLTDGFLDTDATGVVSYKLTGACDSTADWSSVDALTDDNKITAEIVWSVEKHVDQAAPSITPTTYDLVAGQPLNVTVDFGVGNLAATEGTGILKIVNKLTGVDVPTSRYAVNENVITFDATFTTNNAASATDGLDLEVVFTDAANTPVTITLTTKTE